MRSNSVSKGEKDLLILTSFVLRNEKGMGIIKR